jgi:hypothetical protein
VLSERNVGIRSFAWMVRGYRLAAVTHQKTITHKKGRCKRSGQGKTLDQELQINVSEHRAMNRILNSSEIFHHGAGRYIVPAVVYRDSQARISPWCRRKNTNCGHALLQPRQQSGFGCSSSG